MAGISIEDIATLAASTALKQNPAPLGAAMRTKRGAGGKKLEIG